jgi:hypothetical protein
MKPLILEDVRTEEQFIKYFIKYGDIVVCIFEYYGIEKRNKDNYAIIYYKEKHKLNVYNNSEIKRKESTIQECINFIRYESRKYKLEKLQLNIKHKSILNIN